MNETDWAYLAGIVDGEGCLSIYERSRGGGISPILIVQNTSLDLIKWLHETVYTCESALTERKHKRQPSANYYVWTVSNREGLLQVLPNMLSYLVIKKLHAQLILRFYKTFPWDGFHRKLTGDKELMRAYVTLIHDLNSTGPTSSETKIEVREMLKDLWG